MHFAHQIVQHAGIQLLQHVFQSIEQLRKSFFFLFYWFFHLFLLHWDCIGLSKFEAIE